MKATDFNAPHREWLAAVSDDDLAHLRTGQSPCCGGDEKDCVFTDIEREYSRRQRRSIDRWPALTEAAGVVLLVCPDATVADSPAHQPVAAYAGDTWAPVECSCGRVFSTTIEDRDVGVHPDGTDMLNPFVGPRRLPAW